MAKLQAAPCRRWRSGSQTRRFFTIYSGDSSRAQGRVASKKNGVVGKGMSVRLRRVVYLMLRVALAALVATASAQKLPIEQIQLRGDRFHGLSYAEMTPEQRVMLDHTVNSARAVTNTTANGPLNVLLRSPEIGDLV